jgi:hypothetical protein
MENETLTITLTERPPVKIIKSEWPKIADARDHDGQYISQANRKWYLNVRQHADGRTIVYGIYDTHFAQEKDLRGGELLDPGEDIARAIVRVAEHLGFRRQLADECISRLPAEEI